MFLFSDYRANITLTFSLFYITMSNVVLRLSVSFCIPLCPFWFHKIKPAKENLWLCVLPNLKVFHPSKPRTPKLAPATVCNKKKNNLCRQTCICLSDRSFNCKISPIRKSIVRKHLWNVHAVIVAALNLQTIKNKFSSHYLWSRDTFCFHAVYIFVRYF